jgi:hypothetical protein
MKTPIHWHSRGRTQVKPAVQPRWQEIRHGLTLVVLGDVMLLGPGLLGLFLTGRQGTLLLARLGVGAEDAALLSTSLAVLGAVLGYALAMIGQLRCFGHSPRTHGAKGLVLGSVLCSLAAPLCLAAATRFPEGAESYVAFSRNPGALLELDFQRLGVVLPFAGLLLVVLGILLLSGFALAVVHRLRDPGVLRAVTRYFCFVGFLVGGTVGLILEAQRTSCQEALVALPLGWLLCLLWHTLLLQSVGRRLRHPECPPEPAPTFRRDSDQPSLHLGPYGCWAD